MKYDYYYCQNSEPWDKSKSYIVHAALPGSDRFLCGGRPYSGTPKNIIFNPYVICEKCKLLKDNGLQFEVLHAGQVRRYGETRYDFAFKFIGENEACPNDDIVYAIAQKIHPARDGDKKHPLMDSVIIFQRMTGKEWQYTTGHEYTD